MKLLLNLNKNIHSHVPMTKTINGTPIVVNPFGYVNECLYTGINETVIEFE